MNKRFSVIIPNYNSEKWIKKCLDSILNQTYKNYEVIIIDDISTDNSLKIIEKYKNKFDELKIYKNESKRLNGGTRNVGILKATGDYIIFIDSDDWFKNNYVFEKINNSINDEDVLFVGYDFLFNNKVDENIPKYETLDEALRDVTCAPWTKIVKTSILKETLFPEGTMYEDRIQHYKTLLKCKTYNILYESIYVWNRMGVSTINKSNYSYYAFDYARELIFLIKNINDGDFKEFLKKELKGYINRINELAGEIYE